MKLHTKIQLLKFCFTLLNCIFLALGVSAAGCGVWILFDTSFISVISSDDLQLVAVMLLAAGALVLVVGVLGLVGARRESRLLLLPVAAFLLLLILAQIFIAFLLLLNGTKISRTVMDTVEKLIVDYPAGEPRLLDNMQHYGKCCGRTGPSDWLENRFVENRSEVLPCSCFRSNRHESRTFCSGNLTLNTDLILYGNNSYSQGCEDALSVWLNENLYTIIGMDVGLILIQVLQLVTVVSLYQSFGAKSSVKSFDPTLSEPDLDQDYRDQDLLHQDQGLYHEAYDGPYEEPHEEPYGEPNPDCIMYRE